MTRKQRIIFLVVHFGWIALWVTSLDLRGKVSAHTSNTLFGLTVAIALIPTVL